MTVTKKSYSGHAQSTALSSNITNTSTSLPIAAAVGFPDTTIGPFVVTIDRGTTNEEKVLIESYTTSPAALIVADNGRGYDGTTAVNHNSGATVVCSIDAASMQDLIDFATSVGTDLPTTSAIGDNPAEGASGIPADALHVHGRESFGAGITTTSAVGDSALDGSSTHPARGDHKHGREPFGAGQTTSSNPGDSVNDGSSVDPARADHKHGRESASGLPFGTGLSSNSAEGDTAGDGSSADVARADHKHGRESFSSSTPAVDSSGGAVGTSTSPARGDHSHPLGPYAPTPTPMPVGGSITGATPNKDFPVAGYVNQINVSGGVSDFISFQTPFPAACDGVIVCGIAPAANANIVNIDSGTVTASGFRATVSVLGSAYTGQSSFCYWAWGH